jgi:hypothetical protein
MCHGRDGTTSHLIGGRGSRLKLSIKCKTYSIPGEMHYRKDFPKYFGNMCFEFLLPLTILIDGVRTTILVHFLN